MKEQDWIRARVTDRIDWTSELFTLRFDAELEPFRPGQFAAVGVDAPEDSNKKRIHRLYSIASAPGEPAEFFVIEVEGGEVSPFLSGLQPGDEGWVSRKPKGLFTLARVPEADVLWLVATGTGLAPFLSMLRTPEPWKRFDRIVVLQGARTNAELAYTEDFERHAAEHYGRFQRICCVTREEPGPGALSGRITEALEDGRLAETAGVKIDAATSHFMLCGNPAMIDQMSELLRARGLTDNTRKSPGNITFERYW